MNFDMKITCTNCGKENIVTLSQESQKNVNPAIQAVLTILADELKSFRWKGQKVCSCGKSKMNATAILHLSRCGYTTNISTTVTCHK